MASTQDAQASTKQEQTLKFNKVCEYEDFKNPELQEIIRDVFPHEARQFSADFPVGAEYRKYWEIGMTVRALRHFGVLRRDASILGVAAGTETTIFYLTNYAGLVYATDLYMNPGVWGQFAPGFMLHEPEKVTPYEFERERLIVQHMDGRLLHYPDNTFDGIFSSSSIEHFGDLDLIANSAYEMGRVLKPGGVLTLSTEFKIAGPPGGHGWPGLAIFTREDLLRYIVEASGLEIVDELDTSVSDATLESKRDLLLFGAELAASAEQQGLYPRVGEVIWSTYPHIVLVHQGYVFTSVHLTLRKPENYPSTPNSWAKPNQKTIKAVNELAKSMSMARSAAATSQQTTTDAAPADIKSHFEYDLAQWGHLRRRSLNSRVNRLPGPLAFIGRTLIRIRGLGTAWELQQSLHTHLGQYISQVEAQQNERFATLEAQQAERFAKFEAQQKEQFAALKKRVDATTGNYRMLLQHLDVPEASADDSGGQTFGSALVQLIQQLEQKLPQLASAQAIDLSIQSGDQERSLVDVTAYFDERMSAKEALYRGPNDGVYHVDFTDEWNRPILFENAELRLKDGGHFVLITSAGNTSAPDAGELQLVFERQLPLSTGIPVQVYVWQKA